MNNNMRPKITHVAIRFNDVIYSLPEPNRHNDVIYMIVRQNPDIDYIDVEEEGFLDAEGHFLNRKQALVSAQLNDQLKDPNNVRLNMLFSEDLW